LRNFIEDENNKGYYRKTNRVYESSRHIPWVIKILNTIDFITDENLNEEDLTKLVKKRNDFIHANSTTGDKVINKIVSIAMDDTHSGQMAALKMCMDRVLPTSLFEKDAKGQRNAVTINITGIGDAKVEAAEIVDVEVTDVEYNDES
jgi:hypothetical protein